MSETPTLPPRTLALHETEPCYEVFMDEYEKLELELTAVTEQLDKLQTDLCWKTREAGIVTEQRDRLAEALNRIANNNIQDEPSTDYAYELGRMEGIAKIALQSLNQNANVHPPL